MRKTLLAALLVGCVGVLFSTTAGAQYEEEEDHGKLNVRVGVFRPAGTLERNLTNNNWFVEGLAYDYSIDKRGHPVGQVALALLEPSGDSSTSMFTATVRKLRWKDSGGDKLCYFGAGVGASKLKFLGDKAVKYQGELFVGYDFNQAYYVELSYTAMQSWFVHDPWGGSGTVNFSGYGLAFGARKLF